MIDFLSCLWYNGIMNVERLFDGRSFVDPEGDVRSMADWLPEMEPQYPEAATIVTAESAARNGLSRGLQGTKKRRRRGAEPLFGRDAGLAIDEVQSAAEAILVRDLTDDDRTAIALDVERKGRGL